MGDGGKLLLRFCDYADERLVMASQPLLASVIKNVILKMLGYTFPSNRLVLKGGLLCTARLLRSDLELQAWFRGRPAAAEPSAMAQATGEQAANPGRKEG